MRKINTSGLDESLMRQLTSDEASWIYNGLDCCVTLEVYYRLAEELADSPECVQETYETSNNKQAPFMEIGLRGLLVDEGARQESIEELQFVLDDLNQKFQRIVQEVFGHGLNWDSPVQMKTFFYGTLRIKEIKKRNAKGQYVATVDEQALNRICLHPYAQLFARFVLKMRNVRKKIGFLKTSVDPDNRMRTNLNIAGTNTGRLSSSESEFGTGTNLQNIDNTLRYPFIADPKQVLVNIDLEQADARNVGAIIWNLFLESHGPEEAGRYLDACESGDLHTFVCRMAWSDLPWPEDQSGWRAVADRTAYKEMSYRDLAKRLGHGTNYLGTPPTMAKHTQTERGIIETFQNRYFAAFPLISEWHKHVIKTIASTGVLTTMFGRRRTFFGRGNDSKTHREAVAYEPQSMTGHEIDMGILNLWRYKPDAELLMQVHDSVLLQVPWHNHQTHIEEALKLMRFEHELKGGRIFSVPLEALVGWNWGKYSEQNKHGVAKWKGEETRRPPLMQRLSDYG